MRIEREETMKRLTRAPLLEPERERFLREDCATSVKCGYPNWDSFSPEVDECDVFTRYFTNADTAVLWRAACAGGGKVDCSRIRQWLLPYLQDVVEELRVWHSQSTLFQLTPR